MPGWESGPVSDWVSPGLLWDGDLGEELVWGADWLTPRF